MDLQSHKDQKQKVPPKESRFLSPLYVIVEKYGEESARVRGDLSKESLKDLLMSSLMLIPRPEITDPKMKGKRFRREITDDAQEFASEIQKDVQGQMKRSKARKRREEAKRRKREERKEERRKVEEKKKKVDKKAKKKLPEDYGDWISRWPVYGEQSVQEQSTEIEEHIESLPSCPSSNTEDTNLSYDGKWLRRHMKYPLRMAMKEIVLRKPYDPVNYLGFWLLNYRRAQEEAERQRALDAELNLLRSVIKEKTPPPEEEEHISDRGGEEEIPHDVNFENYDMSQIVQ